MSEKQKNYVYQNVEVKLTLRQATKTLKATRKGTTDRVAVLYEITPVDSMNGSWKKWVQKNELFEIT